MSSAALLASLGLGLAAVFAECGRRERATDARREGERTRRGGPPQGGSPRSNLAVAPGSTSREGARLTTGPNAWWAASLRDAGVDGDPARWAARATAAVAGAAVLGWLRGEVAGAMVVAGVVMAGGAIGLRSARGRGARLADAGLPLLLEHVARSVRGGLDLVPALGHAAEVVGGVHAEALRAVTARVGGGLDLGSALRRWETAHPRPAVRLAVGALEVASLAGGARSRAIDAVAATLRARGAVAEETRALASQARASAAVLIGLPIAFAVLGSAADPEVAHTLLATPLGLACVVTAAALDCAGAWWMQRIVAGYR